VIPFHFTGTTIMKIQLILPDLVALLEIVDEHIDRTFPGIGPPASLRKLRTKLIHLTQVYPRSQDAVRSGSNPDHTGRGLEKSKRTKAVRKRRAQAQTAR
jgi:hypothetical protein